MKKEFSCLLANEQETMHWAFSFAKIIKGGDVIALEGDLGAGKTTICKWLCKALGFNGVVSSPSYAIVNEYQNEPFIYHLDLYRIKNETDLQDIGIDSFIYSNAITLIEWAKMAKSFPLNIKYTVAIKIINENTREITVFNS